uniref:Auxin efflux carrier component n=1 Tax=Pyramimonas obovata TaxID=1411642 RepID=A0A7S0QU83_9CHLO|mmetsp:Transcript_12401/g.26102  ORF Transcript_12401/g.26102 Transcript_12401/m.26102 type:complete len:441 (+) Transcript_12401:214-1536(+)|eukprot:CAMPEP_0118926572 /NCGR_PEP_ID=MMETSP1169-20130426/4229_1 /TAXON_ID=36882 /ORGANISM="Pyramimonas obovata, Strain CCMP722" /LENGTH=440 /DNA_ID=CAMNT_0006868145 /DNA_START=214 /DNA_END=1536 /DNA_ORIENTATION=-
METALLLASLRAVGNATVMAAVGGYLAHRNFLTKPGLALLANISVEVTIPCLLFTTILGCNQDWSDSPCPSVLALVEQSWPLLLLPFVYVGLGVTLGQAILHITNVPADFRAGVVCAVGFANSTGMPITLLSVIHNSFPPDTQLGRVDPLIYLSAYMLTNPIVQWSFGTWLLEEGCHSWLLEAPLEETLGAPLLDNPSHHNEHSESTESLRSESSAHEIPQADSQETRPHALSVAPPPPSTTRDGTTTVIPAGTHSKSDRMRRLARTVLKPPVLAVQAALLVLLVPGLRGLFVDVSDRDNDAPLEFLFNALHRVGQAAVPINMIILGANLHAGASFAAVPWTVNAAVALCRMVLMPIAGGFMAVAIHSLIPLDAGLDASFYLVVMILSATPTANNIMIMVERSGRSNKEAMATCIFTQYMLAPLALCGSISVFVGLAQSL